MNHDHLGFYLVGWKKFYNKTLALIESKKTGYEPMWVFNDKVYGSIDWTSPIETSLLELYKQRALQLREKYDYLLLYFSGGADSANILHAFIDNDIFLDEIIIQDLELWRSHVNDQDLSNKNFYSEIEFAANAHLKKYKDKINPKTKITYQDFSKTGIELLEKDYWLENSSLCLTITVSGVLRQVTQEHDSYNLGMMSQGKQFGYILGVDKPLVYFDGENYYCFFKDTGAYHYVSPVDFSKTAEEAKNVSTEFFYWTPDMPEIVVKQAQEIKRNCEQNPWAKYMASQSLVKHIAEYRDVLHPVIYPPHIVERFQTEKPSTNIYRPMDEWFWKTASDKVKHNYVEAVKFLGQNIDTRHTIQNSIEHGFNAHKTKFYKL